ncbi:MAG: putative hydrolase, alpha/beta hydrolase family [Marmoricola sp.]|nr:putative hydrolase, alpha/beta hydrolase family [Marmoricola sp.]
MTRAPIVLVAPAMAIGSAYYRPLTEALQDRGWEARALPRRGFEPDQPSAGRARDWSYLDEIDDLAAAVAQARAERPDRPVLLLGHSLGGQLAAGHELTRPPVDGLVTVGGCLPHFRDYPYAGLHILAMGALVVPTLTTVFGYLPRPAFGGPGARTLMRQWARMALTGTPPYPVDTRVRTPTLAISLEGDDLAPARAVDAFARRLFEPGSVTRWHYRDADVPDGASNDHVAWVRSPETVVRRIETWWAGRST